LSRLREMAAELLTSGTPCASSWRTTLRPCAVTLAPMRGSATERPVTSTPPWKSRGCPVSSTRLHLSTSIRRALYPRAFAASISRRVE
jgi:hypothetical protein